jgi:hypothetical protein
MERGKWPEDGDAAKENGHRKVAHPTKRAGGSTVSDVWRPVPASCTNRYQRFLKRTMLQNIRGLTILVIIILILIVLALLLWPARDPQEPVPPPGARGTSVLIASNDTGTGVHQMPARVITAPSGWTARTRQDARG